MKPREFENDISPMHPTQPQINKQTANSKIKFTTANYRPLLIRRAFSSARALARIAGERSADRSLFLATRSVIASRLSRSFVSVARVRRYLSATTAAALTHVGAERGSGCRSSSSTTSSGWSSSGKPAL